MSHFCITTIFLVFFVFISSLTAGLPEEKAKLYKECLELTESEKFTKMVQIMRGQIPLQAAMTDVGNEHGKDVVKPPKLLVPMNEAEAKSSMTMNTGKVLNLNYDNIISSLAEFLTNVKREIKVRINDGREYGTFASDVDYGKRKKLMDAKKFLAMHKLKNIYKIDKMLGGTFVSMFL